MLKTRITTYTLTVVTKAQKTAAPIFITRRVVDYRLLSVYTLIKIRSHLRQTYNYIRAIILLY